MSKFLTHILLASQILMGFLSAAESTEEPSRASSDDYSIDQDSALILQFDTKYDKFMNAETKESDTTIQCCNGRNYTLKDIQTCKEMTYKTLTLLSFIPAAILPLCTHISKNVAFGYAILTSVILTNLNASQLLLPIDPNKPILSKLSTLCATSLMTGLAILAWVEWQSDISSKPKPPMLTYAFAMCHVAAAVLWMKGTVY